MANDQPKRWERQVREAALRVEEDLRRVVAYINDQVVPGRPSRQGPRRCAPPPSSCRSWPSAWTIAAPRHTARARLLLNPLRQRRTSRSLEPHRSSPPPQCHRAWPGAGQDSELGAASRACAWPCGLPPQEQDGPPINLRRHCPRPLAARPPRVQPIPTQPARPRPAPPREPQPPLRNPCRTASRSPARLAWQAGTARPTPTARRPTAASTTRTP